MTITLLQANARHIPLPSGSVHCVVTSPPYWGLRDYGHNGQLGLARAPDCLGWATGAPCGECYVCMMVQVFREVRRVLRDDGVCFLNLGDSYARNGGTDTESPKTATVGNTRRTLEQIADRRQKAPNGLKPKDLCGIPWRVALALQADGWWLRSDIVWHKKSPMPESVTDRPTRAHEFIFLLSKRERYFYDADAVKESSTGQNGSAADFRRDTKEALVPGQTIKQHRLDRESTTDNGSRNQRDVWTLGPSPYPGAHYATFPPELPRRCILAGTSAHGVCPACGAPWRRVTDRRPNPAGITGGQHREVARSEGIYDRSNRDYEAERMIGQSITTGWLPSCACNAGDPVPATVLDPFVGSGTTLMVARALGRNGIGLDLSADYLQQARQRLDLDKLDAWHGEEPTPGAMDDFDALPLFAA